MMTLIGVILAAVNALIVILAAVSALLFASDRIAIGLDHEIRTDARHVNHGPANDNTKPKE